ncbi:MAG: carbamoyltransferase HypF [Phycisphaerae bacterium]|nr:carbamoyltransferase HypF [Phycisphaerae bacterium]
MSRNDENPALVRRRLVVRGQVQGVGFRPFVYRLATDLALAGFVRNDGVGVTIELQADRPRLDRFTQRLRAELPAVARIDFLDESAIEPQPDERAFRILHSDHTTAQAAQADVTVDLATCDDCVREMFDPADRRFGYPFINCTNCGPRYSIIRDVPYDRPMTTMSVFTMCPACQAEYDNPLDRRFHAQPNACPVCGPAIWLLESPIAGTPPFSRRTEGPRSDAAQVIATAATALLAGKILAIRGLGGFHLAVRADQDAPVARLRERKNREHKPLALMVRDLAAAEQLVELTDEARKILLSPQRPIVIARWRPGAPVSRHVASGTNSLGVMLPYTPLHHLLLAELARRWSVVSGQWSERERIASSSTGHWPLTTDHCPLVMTSGNLADEPLLASNNEAIAGLGDVADLFLLHNREIHRRIDDSVVEVVGTAMLPMRRARGYVPVGFDLPVAVREHGLAVGGELKSTVAIVRNRGQVGQAILSEHIGDLKDGRVYRHFEQVIAHLLQITHTVPAWIAHDLHPMYLSTQWASRQGLRLIGVQHHHAHIAACLAEHGRTGPAIGIASDGVGYGEDGAIWGGEILIADLADFRRVGSVRTIGLPGGDAAAVRTARPAIAWLFDATGGHVPGVWLDRLLPDRTERDIVLRQLAENFNCPASSAVGRYFDAAAAILGLAAYNHFEAQAPIALEAAIEPGVSDVLPFEIRNEDCQSERAGPSSAPPLQCPRFEIDLRPTVLLLTERTLAGDPVGMLAAAFHNTIAAALAAAAERASESTGLRTVAASGGVFCNRYLTLELSRLLRDRGLELLLHRTVPANDGGLALGQAAVAAARLANVKSEVTQCV